MDHLCRIRPCCNTAHMELVTHAENLRRAAPFRSRKRIFRATTCPNDHEYSPENTAWTPQGWRRCRTCERLKSRRKRQRQHAARARAAA